MESPAGDRLAEVTPEPDEEAHEKEERAAMLAAMDDAIERLRATSTGLEAARDRYRMRQYGGDS